jgi:hypothetical protein
MLAREGFHDVESRPERPKKLIAGKTMEQWVRTTADPTENSAQAASGTSAALRQWRGSNPGGSAGGGVAPRRRRFRSVYATVLEGVLGVDSEVVLGGPFPAFPFM